MNTENKVISIAVGDKIKIEGVGTVELVVVAAETPEQPKIDKQEWLDAVSRLFDSWMKISGGYVPKKNDRCYSVSFIKQNKQFTFSTWVNWIDSPIVFETLEQKDQFIDENEKDLKTFFHQV